MNKWTKNWTTPWRVLLAGAGLSAAALLTPLVVSAVTPSAGTNIKNQAGASYFDTSGIQRTVSSNEVETTVTQVYSLTLASSATKTGAAGNTVSFPHTLTNTGNGNDLFTITVKEPLNSNNFSSIAIYPDANGTGQPSGPALAATCATVGTDFVCTVTDVSIPGNKGTFPFIVGYTLPATVSNGTFETPTVTAKSQGDISQTAANTDTVNSTTGAAFESSKKIGAPGVAAPIDLGSWPTAISTGKASPASCDTKTNASDVANAVANGCTYTVYTVEYKNIGGSAGGYYMNDPLPAGMTYVKGTAVWSGAGGTALYDTNGTLTATSGVSGVLSAYDSASKTFKFDVNSVANNVSGTLSFVVLINKDAKVGTDNPNTTNKANFSSTACDATCAGGTPTTTTTNGSPFSVTPVYKVIAANVGTATTFDSASPPLATLVDVQVQASAFLGRTVSFHNFVINKGNSVDTFNVAINSTVFPTGGAVFPAGTTFAFFKSDGVTPLGDTTSDGIPDTGELAVDGVADIVVVATLPGTGTVPSTKVDALMTATSIHDGLVKDSVWDEVTLIKTSAIDITNTVAGNQVIDGTATPPTQVACTAGSNCDVGQGPSTNPTDTQPTQPGKTVQFPLYINNSDTSGNPTFTITSSVPQGWDVKIVEGSSCSAAAVTQPVTIAAPSGSPLTPPLYTACVTPPTGTPAGTTPITFTVTSTSHPDVTDTIKDAVKVTDPIVPSMQLGPNAGTNSTPPGGTSSTPVTLTNNGTTSCGAGTAPAAAFNVSVTGLPTGWTAVVYIDMNGDGVVGTGDTAIDTSVSATTANLTNTMLSGIAPAAVIPLAPTKTLPLLVKLMAPPGALVGSSATASVTVTDLNADTAVKCPAQTGKYTANVVNGQLRVVKTQAVQSTCPATVPATLVSTALTVKPGECIFYKVVATNEGSGNITGVTVNDTVPANTTYALSQPTGQCNASGANNGAIPPVAVTPTFAGPTAAAVACSLATTNVLAPGGTMTLMYQVMVDPVTP